MNPYFTQMPAYQLLMQYGDDETKTKVEAFVDEYFAVLMKGGFKDSKWTIDVLEPDEESAVKFKKTILIHSDSGVTRQLEILSDFNLEAKRFASHVSGNTVRILCYYEQRGKSILSDADSHVLEITNSADKHHQISSKRGRVFGKWDVVKESTLGDQAEIEKE